jgi:hypothetical protein
MLSLRRQVVRAAAVGEARQIIRLFRRTYTDAAIKGEFFDTVTMAAQAAQRLAEWDPDFGVPQPTAIERRRAEDDLDLCTEILSQLEELRVARTDLQRARAAAVLAEEMADSANAYGIYRAGERRRKKLDTTREEDIATVRQCWNAARCARELATRCARVQPLTPAAVGARRSMAQDAVRAYREVARVARRAWKDARRGTGTISGA